MKSLNITVGFTYANSEITQDAIIVAGESEATIITALYNESLEGDIGEGYIEKLDIEYLDAATEKFAIATVTLDESHQFLITDEYTHGTKTKFQFWAQKDNKIYRDSVIFTKTLASSL